MTENDLILGPIENFIGNIPNENIEQIIKNNKKYKSSFVKHIHYITLDNRIFTEKEFEALNEKAKDWILRTGTVKNKPLYMIAAPADQFTLNSDQYLEKREIKNKPRDPLALIKVDKGYIELSRWLN